MAPGPLRTAIRCLASTSREAQSLREALQQWLDVAHAGAEELAPRSALRAAATLRSKAAWSSGGWRSA